MKRGYGFKASGRLVPAAVCLAVSALFFFTLSLSGAKAAGADGRSLNVAAAADLAFALREIASGFEKDTGARTAISYGSTGMLARQIREGAPFEVFFAADRRYTDELLRDGFLAPGTIELYARGRIVLAVNRSSTVKATALKDLLDPGIKKIAIANPDHAPYGRAAMEALKTEGVWDGVKEKLVYGENIRQALKFIQTGDAQAGIVALSIADVPEIRYSPVDPLLHAPIDQAAAVVKGARDEPLAREFIRYVNGPKGRQIMKRYGFVAP